MSSRDLFPREFVGAKKSGCQHGRPGAKASSWGQPPRALQTPLCVRWAPSSRAGVRVRGSRGLAAQGWGCFSRSSLWGEEEGAKPGPSWAFHSEAQLETIR